MNTTNMNNKAAAAVKAAKEALNTVYFKLWMGEYGDEELACIARKGIAPLIRYFAECEASGKDCRKVLDFIESYDGRTLEDAALLPPGGLMKAAFAAADIAAK